MRGPAPRGVGAPLARDRKVLPLPPLPGPAAPRPRHGAPQPRVSAAPPGSVWALPWGSPVSAAQPGPALRPGSGFGGLRAGPRSRALGLGGLRSEGDGSRARVWLCLLGGRG